MRNFVTQTKQINLSTKRVRQNQTTLSTKREHLACTFFFPRKSYNSVLNITMSYNSVLRSLSIIISSPNLPWFDILPSLSLLLSIPMTANPTRARTTIHWCHLYLPGPMIERTVESLLMETRTSLCGVGHDSSLLDITRLPKDELVLRLFGLEATSFFNRFKMRKRARCNTVSMRNMCLSSYSSRDALTHTTHGKKKKNENNGNSGGI